VKKVVNISIVIFAVSLLASCTSARWTVKDQAATDQSDYEILEENHFLMQAGEVTPEDPVLRLDLFSKTRYKYTQRVLVQRNIQEYKLRPGFVILGLSGAAIAFYAANSNTFRGNGTSTKSVTLNATGGLLALSGFLNMKPVGEPRPTGEERFLRSTGNVTDIDTVQVQEPVNATADVEVLLNGKVIFTEEDRSVSTNQIQIPLASKLNELQLEGENPGSISVNVDFSDLTYNFEYPVDAVLRPYAQVTAQLTALRNSPEESEDNVLADLVRGSQVQIQSSENEDWYRVLYGISESYIRKEDTELLWRSSDFDAEEQVVTVPRVPFGNIDVENNIPILRGPTPNAVGLIVTNQNYAGDLPERNYANRDGRLIKTYLRDALGFPKQKIFELSDISTSSQLYQTLSEIRFVANDSTEFFVYLSGYGSVTNQGDTPELTFLNTNPDSEPIGLTQFFEQISSIPSDKPLVVGDLDFSRAFSSAEYTANQQQRILESHVTELIFGNPTASVLLGSHLDQPSSLYVSATGEDKKHHIFPYFFAKALQQRNTILPDIYQYLERNVSYNTRRLHDRPQDPILLGNSSMDLTN
jgi:hypothetical protein